MHRASVSADNIDDAHEDWEPPVFEHSKEEEEDILAAMKKCFLFSALEKADRLRVAKAWEEHCGMMVSRFEN